MSSSVETFSGIAIPSGVQTSTIHCVAFLRALDKQTRTEWFAPSNTTLQEIVDYFVPDEYHQQIVVTVGGSAFYRAMWRNVRPHDGVTVTVRLLPGTFLYPLISFLATLIPETVLFAVGPVVAEVGLALGLPAGVVAVGSVLVTAGLYFGGLYFLTRLVTSSLIDEPPGLGEGIRGIASSPTARETGNIETPYAPLWRNYGKNRLFPPRLAKPFSVIREGKRRVRECFVIEGPNSVSDLRLGETPAEDLTSQIEIREGWSTDQPTELFPIDIAEDPVGFSFPETTFFEHEDQVAQGKLPFYFEGLDDGTRNGSGGIGVSGSNLSNPGFAPSVVGVSDFLKRTTSEDCDEIAVTLNFPRGLIRRTINNKGDTLRWAETFILQIDYKLADLEDVEANWTYGWYDPTIVNNFAPGGVLPQIKNGGSNPETTTSIGATTGLLDDADTNYVLSIPPGPNAESVNYGRTSAPFFPLEFQAGRDEGNALFNNVPGIQFFGKTELPFFATLKIRPSTGREKYDIRLRRIETGNASIHEESFLRCEFISLSPSDTFADTGGSFGGGPDTAGDLFDRENLVCTQIFVPEGNQIVIGRAQGWEQNNRGGARFLNEGDERHLHLSRCDVISIQCIKNQLPTSLDGLTTVAIEIDAEKAKGLAGKFSATFESYLPRIVGGVIEHPEDALAHQTAVRDDYLSENACDAYLDAALLGENPIAESDMNLEKLEEWRDAITAEGRKTDLVFDYDITKLDAFKTIAGTARASFKFDGNKLSVSRETPNKEIKGLFTPMDVSGFVMNTILDDVPDAIRVKFRNSQKDYAFDQRVVSRDGFSQDGGVDGLPVPTRIQDVELPGTTDPVQVFKDTRVNIALLLARVETYQWSTGLQHLGIERGDKVELQHPAVLIGLGTARINGTTLSSTDITHLSLTNEVRFDENQSYAAKVLVKDVPNNKMVSILLPLVNPTTSTQPVITSDVQLTTPYDTLAQPFPTGTPGEEELLAFGLAGFETIEVIITRKTWHSDLTADLEAVPAADSSFGADIGAIPQFVSNVTNPPLLGGTICPEVSIDSIISDSSAALLETDSPNITRRLVRMRVSVSYSVIPGSGVSLSDYDIQVRHRPVHVIGDFSASHGPWTVQPAEENSQVVFIQPVDIGENYEVQVRTVPADGARPGASSVWSGPLRHTVQGFFGAPPDVENLRIDIFESLNWNYENPPPDLVGFRVRLGLGSHPNWAGSVPLHEGEIEPPFSLNNSGTGLRSLLVKAVDYTGHESENAAVVVTDVSSEIQNVVRTVDEHAAGFAGTIINGAVNGGTGNLEATQYATIMWANADLTSGPHDSDAPLSVKSMWSMTSTDLMWGQVKYHAMSYEWRASVVAADVPGRVFINSDIDSSSHEIDTLTDFLFWTSDAAIFWTLNMPSMLFWERVSNYVPFPGHIEVQAPRTITFRISTVGGSIRGVIKGLSVVVDAPDVVEEAEGFTVAAAGVVRLVPTKTFRVIKQVQIAVEQGAGSAVSWVFLDKNPTLGPSIQTFNQGGTRAIADVDYRIIGY